MWGLRRRGQEVGQAALLSDPALDMDTFRDPQFLLENS